MKVSATSLHFLLPLFLHAQGSGWDIRRMADIAQSIMDERLIPCMGVMYTGNKPSIEVYHLVKKLQQSTKGKFHMLRILRMGDGQPWKMCSYVIHVFMAWQPNAKEEFTKEMKNTVKFDALWITFLPENVSAENFFQDVFMLFASKILTITPSKLEINEIWRVAPGYPIRTALFANWTPKGLHCRRENCSFHKRNDLEGHPIVAATKEDMPLSDLHWEDGRLKIGGYFGDIFYEVVSRLNATTEVRYAAQNVTGSPTQGTWNGLIGMLERNEIDLAVGPLSLQAHTLDVADFVRPLLRTNYQVFFKQAGTVVEWDAFLKPFGKYVWRLILLWFVVAAFFLNYFYKIGVRCGTESCLHVWEYNKINAVLTFLRAFTQQGTDLAPKSFACRGLFLTGYLTSTILLTSYSAALISKLTTQEPIRPFDSLETFLKDGSYKLTAIGASTDYTYFSDATDPTLKAIYQKQMAKDGLPTGKEEGLMSVCNGDKTALFITSAVTKISADEISMERKCPILHFRTPLGTVYLTIGIRKKMPFDDLIKFEVQSMAERGILSRLRNKEWPPRSQASDVKFSPPAVEITQVAQIHAVLLGGIGIAVAVLIVEIIWKTTLGRNIRNRVYGCCGLSNEKVITASLIITGIVVTGTVVQGFV